MRLCLSLAFLASAAFLGACSSDGAPSPDGGVPDGAAPDSRAPDGGAPDGSAPDGGVTRVDVFSTEASAARFLTQATFGPRPVDVQALVGSSASAWFRTQLAQPPSLLLPTLDEAADLYDGRLDDDPESAVEGFLFEANTHGFWRHALVGEDQLRQRVAWALAQLFVVSNATGEVLTDVPPSLAYFQDGLIDGAFGNFRDLLTHVTYAPAMGYYLTFLGSERADPATGRQPDENYARELLQLFTIGVLELAPDGTPTTRDGRTETYTNDDITGLARVFTGFQLDAADVENQRELRENPAAYPEPWRRPLRIEASAHSAREKIFLGATIPANTSGDESVRLALDAIFSHPNVAPFIARQLIQRFVTTAPAPAYVARVAAVFNAGMLTLPDGSSLGTGERGDLAATMAAVLFDEAARNAEGLTDPTFGKVREPMLRYAAFARAFVPEARLTPRFYSELNNTALADVLAQHPYRARSVFNFYRPGYVAPGSESGAAGLTAPELQLVNATTVPGYANFMFFSVAREGGEVDTELLRGLTEDELEFMRQAFVPDYAEEEALANDPAALLAHLDARLTYGTMSAARREALAALVARIDDEDTLARVHLAVWLVLTSPEFLVQH